MGVPACLSSSNLASTRSASRFAVDVARFAGGRRLVCSRSAPAPTTALVRRWLG
jgi:hypothetical protein